MGGVTGILIEKKFYDLELSTESLLFQGVKEGVLTRNCKDILVLR